MGAGVAVRGGVARPGPPAGRKVGIIPGPADLVLWTEIGAEHLPLVKSINGCFYQQKMGMMGVDPL